MRPLFSLALAGMCALHVFAQGVRAKAFDATAALIYTERAVAFGPRPDGSPAIAQLRAWIHRELARCNCEVTSDLFTAQTPDGPLEMENIIAKFPGNSGKSIAISGHYDTKKMDNFVGANDGGSSTGFLLEMAATLQGRHPADDIYLVFFDGEEAVREWSDSDSLYGSRHLAAKWSADGTNARLKALLNVDMIGDANFRLVWETGSSAALRELVWNAADALGYTAAFPRAGGVVEDDHIPFLNAGVSALDLIDFESQSTFWHTPRDTMDKLSARGFSILGAVLMSALAELEGMK